MKNKQISRQIWIACVLIALGAVMLCVIICAGETMVMPVEADKPAELPVVEITYDEAETGFADHAGRETRPLQTNGGVFYPMTMDERDYFAALVAGKAVGEPAGCQQAVATVLLNTLNACGGDVAAARKAYTWDDVQTPTDDTYNAVDAVFTRGEVLLDDDVLYLGTAGHEDAFHAGLTEVCTIGGITFYKEP